MFSRREAELEEELFRACEASDVDRVRRAIAAGVDPKKATKKDSFYKETPLHIACRYPYSSKFSWHNIFVNFVI